MLEPSFLGNHDRREPRNRLGCKLPLEFDFVAQAEPLIRNISDTALLAAVYRARETERPDALFRDPFARRLADKRVGIDGGAYPAPGGGCRCRRGQHRSASHHLGRA